MFTSLLESFLICRDALEGAWFICSFCLFYLKTFVVQKGHRCNYVGRVVRGLLRVLLTVLEDPLVISRLRDSVRPWFSILMRQCKYVHTPNCSSQARLHSDPNSRKTRYCYAIRFRVTSFIRSSRIEEHGRGGFVSSSLFHLHDGISASTLAASASQGH